MKLEDITLNHLKILKTVHDHQSFSKAAEVLDCSQSLISKKVKQLETYFDTRLLKRSPGAISLTHKGERLVSKVYSVYEDFEGLFEEFQSEIFDPASQEIVIGTTSLLSALWFKLYLYRIMLCFPDQKIRQTVTSTNDFSSSERENLHMLINSSSAYQSQHCCNRLQTHQLFLVAFGSTNQALRSQRSGQTALPREKIDFEQIVLLEEVYRDLSKSLPSQPEALNLAQLVSSYQDLINTLVNTHKSTILPSFCLAPIRQKHEISALPIQGVRDYGIYIHVPNTSELLILSESLVRSFQLEQDALEPQPKFYLSPNRSFNQAAAALRIGMQRDSIGQIIAGHGVNYISEQLRRSPPDALDLPEAGIDKHLDLQVSLFSSGDLMTRQMKRDDIDICILDDMSLLRNGSTFFDQLGFNSKLIGIASYNIAGEDISIVLPKSSKIKTVAELKGKRISVLLGTNAHRFIVTLFDSCGYDVKVDCTLIDEDSRTASNSLANSSIDAHICCTTFARQLEEHNFSRTLDQSQTSTIRLPSLRGIVCRSEIIRDHPQAVITYLYYLVLANSWFLSNPDQAAHKLSQFANFHPAQIFDFFAISSGNRIDPTLKPQWSWLLKTLNRRLENRYDISKFDVDFWIDDYFLRLTYSLLGLDYHFQQVSLASEFSNSYFVDEKFSKYIAFLNAKIAA
ncbi:LysR family transcriptional regulator [cf. Phormidesmis sp. LEGE 11477]|uniref:LysR family transcriptional regulator n=1 Tax=cf. Phormidesmis sp. LEGE 11477 TaxID=1828680 RepID=UPI00187EA46D|nr:LysR family transcriptional regulator [cf. Phormidesmis sp. LEGE 11477]MBE9061393.1 LysR family transcriptional regulator [cf. Phormidesmis sp. LEGE 11477]